MLDETEVAHDLAPEARVEKVQNRVRDAADVLVDRKPVGDFRGIERRFAIVWVAVAVEIPRGVYERVHRIGFAARGATAFRARSVDEFGSCCEWRFAFAREFGTGRQQDRQIFVGDRLQSVLRAIDDRNWSAPVPLTGNAPVAETEDHFPFAKALLF